MDTIYRVLALPLSWFYDFTGSYVVAMILYAILIKIVLFPFGIKQQKNMVKQAKLRPKEQAIRDRYKGRSDKPTQMKMNEELQKLYQEEGYSPLSGCGTSLIQLPVIFILYRIVYKPISYILGASAEVVGKIVDILNGAAGSTKYSASSELTFLSKLKDQLPAIKNIEGLNDKLAGVFASESSLDEFLHGFKVFGVDVLQTPNVALNADFWKNEGVVAGIVLILIPLLTFGAQYFSMKIVRKMSYQPAQDQAAASSLKIMDFAFPAMTLFMGFILPGMLGIYWIINSLLAIVQQFVLKKMFPLPTFTEEDYKAAAKAMNGKLPKPKKPAEKKYNPKSLHHIDDDDEEMAEPAPKKPEGKKNPFIDPAPEKDADDQGSNADE